MDRLSDMDLFSQNACNALLLLQKHAT